MSENQLEESNTENMLDSFDHVVVLMLENRSFDNLLGYLYQPSEIKSTFPLGQQFEGLYEGEHCNPIPSWADAPIGIDKVCVTRSTNYHYPYPDPGEVYAHVNTQLFGCLNPESNRGLSDEDIQSPFNLPNSVPNPPPMNGFVMDYISTLQALKDSENNLCAKKPSLLKKLCLLVQRLYQFFVATCLKKREPPEIKDGYENYKRIMECFQPDQVPVLSTLAKEFAVFDHWHCSVPSQTWCNRAFWHASTSWGHVINGPNLDWIKDSEGKTLFNLMEETKLSWNVYTDNPVSLTGIIHACALESFHFDPSHFKSMSDFLKDVQAGTLPKYSFVEPRFLTPHNDQHPSSYDSTAYGESAVGSVLLGDLLINQVYNAIRTSNSETGNNWQNTLLIITHDEHGGCYDHVAPSSTIPPGASSRQEEGFQFDRMGVRVPMVMVSAHIKPNTIVNTSYEHSSFIKTMCQKWGLPHLTKRDENAPVFSEVFTSKSCRDVSTWPVIPDPTLPEGWQDIDFSEAPLNDLQHSILQTATALTKTKNAGLDTSQIKTVGEANKILQSITDLPGAKVNE